MSNRILSSVFVMAFIMLTRECRESYAAKKEDVKATAILKSCMQEYKEGGVSGLVALSQKQYEIFDNDPTEDNLRHAVLVDLFGWKIDVEMSLRLRFPSHEYFAKKHFSERVAPRLKEIGEPTSSKLKKWLREASKVIVAIEHDELI